MGQIKVDYDAGGIKGLHIITPKKHEDSRGYLMETFNTADMDEAGIEFTFMQENQSKSSRGVLRGMHYQIRYPQAKLIRVVTGEIFDVVIDLREGSDTYGKWYGMILSAENCKQMLIPRGFAHGFLVLSEDAEICYKCDDLYHPDDEGGIAWDDPDVGIEWPIPEGMQLILSEKDKDQPGLYQKSSKYEK